MERLFGITVQERAISQPVSVDLQDAHEGIASVGPAHSLAASAALALLMLVNELTDSSGVRGQLPHWGHGTL